MILPSQASISMKGLTGHWTKWGGNRNDVFERQGENFDVWFCQDCGRQHTKEMAPYFKLHLDEYIRVCAICVGDEHSTRIVERIKVIEWKLK